jgi:hypothetical protein
MRRVGHHDLTGRPALDVGYPGYATGGHMTRQAGLDEVSTQFGI